MIRKRPKLRLCSVWLFFASLVRLGKNFTELSPKLSGIKWFTCRPTLLVFVSQDILLRTRLFQGQVELNDTYTLLFRTNCERPNYSAPIPMELEQPVLIRLTFGSAEKYQFGRFLCAAKISEHKDHNKYQSSTNHSHAVTCMFRESMYFMW